MVHFMQFKTSSDVWFIFVFLFPVPGAWTTQKPPNIKQIWNRKCCNRTVQSEACLPSPCHSHLAAADVGKLNFFWLNVNCHIYILFDHDDKMFVYKSHICDQETIQFKQTLFIVFIKHAARFMPGTCRWQQKVCVQGLTNKNTLWWIMSVHLCI